jgi:DivIVA domain-containing protein
VILTSVGGGREPEPSKNEADEPPAETSEATEPMVFGSLLGQVPADIRDVSFAGAVRGYDKREVDAYVERVNRIIAELEVSRSPQSAVKHALDRVGEQTSGVLQRAREVAEDLTGTALAEADHATRRAKVEAEEMVEKARMQAHQHRGEAKDQADEILGGARAEAAKTLEEGEENLQRREQEAQKRLRALREEIEAAEQARMRLLDELRRTAAELEDLAGAMVDRGPAEASDSPTEKIPKSADARRSRGDAPTEAHHGRPLTPAAAASRRRSTGDAGADAGNADS